MFAQVLYFQNIEVRQDRIVDTKDIAVGGILGQQIAVPSCINACCSDDLFPYGIYRGIGNLGEQLLEIIKQRSVL